MEAMLGSSDLAEERSTACLILTTTRRLALNREIENLPTSGGVEVDTWTAMHATVR